MSLTDQQLADVGVDVAHHFGGGAYIKETAIPCGATLTQHAHAHDHLSYLVRGRVMLTVDGVAREVAAPSCLVLRAQSVHEVHALTDVMWLCVWATDCEDAAAVDAEIEGAAV